MEESLKQGLNTLHGQIKHLNIQVVKIYLTSSNKCSHAAHHFDKNPLHKLVNQDRRSNIF